MSDASGEEKVALPSFAETNGHSSSANGGGKKAKSCQECRRLKVLKCSRTWPCTNCRRRGVQNLCPDGVLEYSTTEQHQKTCRRLLDRIVELERIVDLISGEEGTGAASGKPLKLDGVDVGKGKGKLRLAPNLLTKVAERSESGERSSEHSHEHEHEADDTEVEDAEVHDKRFNDEIGVLNVSEGKLDSVYSYVGHSGAPLLLSAHEALSAREMKHSTTMLPANFIIPSPTGSAPVATTLQQMVATFPTVDEARSLAQSFFNNVSCYYRILEPKNVDADLKTLYATQNSDSNASTPTPEVLFEGARKLHPHRLAVLCMIFAHGYAFFPSPPRPPTLFFNFAQNLLSLPSTHFMSATTISACETLHLMTAFLFNTGQTESQNSAWPLLGLCLRLAQAMGLHKDSRRWRGGVGEEKWRDRERVWWECVSYDRLQSLNFGRPYLCANYQMDAKPPALLLENAHFPSADTFHNIRYELARFFADVSDALCNGSTYDHVCKIDQRIRTIERTAPEFLQLQDGVFNSIERFQAMGVSRDESKQIVAQQHMLSLLIHKALLYLHRPWFAKALQTDADPMNSPYVSSFVACVTSARKYAKTFRFHPAPNTRHCKMVVLSLPCFYICCHSSACYDTLSPNLYPSK
ncbi:hypothetical protein BT69DRAFT_794956 [Atractiella rhizophila]|nr:hypothetical protein BT69DRAFT_794956 [Atractiella rhizophila]